MKLHEFLSHHKIALNPFAEEDAQTDPVFKEHCISSTYHPAWDKVFGSPADPSTSIVFGEKGAGKTALRLQVERHIELFNRDHPAERCFVVAYDDLNPILDQFHERVARRSKRPKKILQQFQLWDHMDAILSLAVTKLVSGLIQTGRHGGATPEDDPYPHHLRRRLDRHQKRDLLLLASCYDDSKVAPLKTRWRQLRRRSGGGHLSSWWLWLAGLGMTVVVIGALFTMLLRDYTATSAPASALSVESSAQLPGAQEPSPPTGPAETDWWNTAIRPYWWAFATIVVLAWVPWLWRSCQRWLTAVGITRHLRVLQRRSWPLSRLLMQFSSAQLARQPLPNKNRTDDRYSLLNKLQGVLQSLGYRGMIVLVDRIDEPHLINGSTEAMRAFLWPMLDNKFLKQEGLGMKFLLPIELTQFIDREDRDFYQRARLDKQNLIPSLKWSGQALYDVANARLAACSDADPPPKLAELLDESLSDQRVFDAFQSLRVPRHMFRFLYRAIMAHCNKYSAESPSYRISSETFESELAVYRREQEAADRGLGA